MTHFQMYLVTRLDTIIGLSLVGIILAVVAMILGSLFWAVDGDGSESRFIKLIKWTIPPVCVFSLLLVITPSTKEVALIYAVSAIINNEDVKAIPPELMKLARTKIEEMLKEDKK